MLSLLCPPCPPLSSPCRASNLTGIPLVFGAQARAALAALVTSGLSAVWRVRRQAWGLRAGHDLDALQNVAAQPAAQAAEGQAAGLLAAAQDGSGGSA